MIMGGLSPVHWLIVIVVVALLFGGRGKLSSIMGDAAKGIRAFKDGLKNEDEAPPAPPAAAAQITPPPPVAAERPREDVRS
jgi:sec-independent protein translocase protein TatA